jgi:cytochrome c
MTVPMALTAMAAALTFCCACDARSNDVGAALGVRHRNPEVTRGLAAIQRYDCGVCHEIPGVDGAHGLTAAPLTRFARRSFVGGVVPNTPDDLTRWLLNPRALDPLTAMPSVGMSEQDARDIAAYLYELR